METKQIEKYIDDFTESFMPPQFQWRKGQKEAIIQIILTYFEGKHKAVILDSPVGSGKSIIAMCASWILNKRKKKGYILASDISLQEQYEFDFQKFNLNWGSIKGIDNYQCIDNLEKHSLGTCKIRNIAPQRMNCYPECPYYVARNKASKSPTSLLNYAYFLIMMNYVNPHLEKEKQIFPKRDFLVCDEGHKVLDIVQNHYSPRFTSTTVEKIEKLKKFFNIHNIKDHTKAYLNIKENIAALWDTENQEKMADYLKEIEFNLESFFDSINFLKDKIKDEYPKSTPPKKWREAAFLSDWVKDFHCKVEDYNKTIDKTSTRNIIKNPAGDEELVFNCLEENYMMHQYFHKWSDFTIFMSATFSDPRVYIKTISLPKAKYIKVNNSFDFTKSPIYFYNKRRMSYRHIESNLPWLTNKVNEILDKHSKENGIIHTASYNLTMKIHNQIDKKHKNRILVYTGTKEKRKVLEILKRDKSKVLIGPSLLEGLDLKDSWSRFQIFGKIPYLSLGDRFVKTKMNIDPAWYQWKAIIHVLQGTGRSVRNEKDWAVTYILDGSLADLIHNNRKSFPPEFMQRLQIVNE